MKKIFNLTRAGALACAILSGGSAGAVSLTNGGFEDPVATAPITSIFSTEMTGWTVMGGNIEIIKNTYWQPSAGTQSIDLNGLNPGIIKTTVTGLKTGSMYKLLFDMSANPIGGANTKAVRATAGSATAEFSFDRTQLGFGFQNMLWEEKALAFTALGPSAMLVFQDISLGGAASGPALDNIRVELMSAAIPLPASVPLLASALAGLAALRRTRRAMS